MTVISKKGYIQYKLANFINSFRHFSKAALLAKEQKKWVLYAISIFNIKSLKTFIQIYAWEHPNHDEVLKEIDRLDLHSKFSFIKRQKVFGGELLKWLIDESFFNQTYFKVTETVNKIENHYFLQLNGGRSSNGNVLILMSELYQITSFLNFNYIIYDGFSNFNALIEQASKGYVAGFSMFESQNSRLHHFNSNILRQMLDYGKPESIKQYYDRFNAKPFQLYSGKSRSFLLDNSLRVLEGLDEIQKITSFLEPGNSHFFQIRESFTVNLLMLISLSEIDSSDVRLFGQKIVENQDKHQFLHVTSVTWLKVFMQSKGGALSLETYKRLIELSIKQGVLHDPSFIDVLIDEIRKHYPSLLLSVSQVQKVCSIYIEKCEACGYTHPKITIIHYWHIATEEGKTLIQNAILQALKSKFDPSLFYVASIFKVIDHKLLIDEFIEYAKPYKSNTALKNAYEMEGTMYVGKIDQLANLLFLFYYDLKEARFDDFRNFSIYYKWLFDMGGFDYDKFDPLWLLHYPTSIYLEKVKRVSDIGKKVKAFLKSNQSPVLLNIFLDHLGG